MNPVDFSNKSQEMCQFFKKRGYPDSVVNATQHHAQQIDRHRGKGRGNATDKPTS